MKTKKTFSLRLGIGSAFGLLVSCSALILGVATFEVAKTHFRNGLRAKIESVALTAASMVDPAIHSKLLTKEDEATAEYELIRDTFRKIRKANPEVRFIYSMRKGEKGPYFVVDAEEDPTKVSHVGDPYPEASASIFEFLDHPSPAFVETEFSSDQWGTFLSGYAAMGASPEQFEAMVGVDVNAQYVIDAEHQLRNIIALCTLGTIVFSSLLGMILAVRLSKPLVQLADEVRRVENLDLDSEWKLKSSIREISELGAATEGMKRGLTSFRKYVPADLVMDLLKRREEAKLGTARRTITVMFSDIADFTTISEKLSSEQLAEVMALYLGKVSDVIKAHGGTIDKFIGDAVMAFWGAPNDAVDHAARACAAALECQSAVRALNETLVSRGLPALTTRIGINTGEAIVGNIGTEQRMSYTAIGDIVNLASRVEGINKEYHTDILVCESTKQACGPDFTTRIVDRVVVKGKTVPVSLYELMPKPDVVALHTWEYLRQYNEAMTTYFSGNLEVARRLMGALLVVEPNDFLVGMHHERISKLLKDNPGNKVHQPRVMTSK